MKPPNLRYFVGDIRSTTQAEINNVAIWATAASQALNERMKDDVFVASKDFRVPSRHPEKTVFRSAPSVRTIFTEAVTSKLYWTTVIYLVSLAEDALLDLVRAFLQHDPRRFLTDNGGKKLDFRSVIEAGDFDSVLECMTNSILHEVSYQKPADQVAYIQRVLGITFRDDLSAEWFEIKATRDILVHNRGIANGIYRQKAGSKARAELGTPLRIDREYFDHVAVTLKALIGGVCSAIQIKLKKDEQEKNKA